MARRVWPACLQMPNVRAAAPAMMAVVAAVSILLAGTVVVYLLAGVRPMWFLDDPASVTRTSPLIGALSVLGVNLWIVAATAALFAVAARPNAPRRHRSLLKVVGVASIVLALDDQFMVHEGLMDDLFGLGELWTIIPYALLGLAVAVRYWRVALAHPDGIVLLAALTFLGLSLGLDVTHPPFPGRMTAEEAAKLIGVALWALFAVRAALRLSRGFPGADHGQGSPTTTSVTDAPPTVV